MKFKTFAYWLILFFITRPAVAQTDISAALELNLESYEYPFPVKFIQLTIQQQPLQMAYMDVVPAKPNGKAVLLLHGKNFNGAYWRSAAKHLSDQGFRVIIPDQIGFGKSSKPTSFQYSFQQLASNTKMLLDTLRVSKVHVVGHSMGGMLAARLALMFPVLTNSLTLVNPIGLEDWKLKVPYKTVDEWYERELKQTEEGIRKYQQANYYHGTWKAEYDEWMRPLAGLTKHPDYPLIAWNSALTYDMIFTQPVLYEFSKIKSPVLLIIGLEDRTAIGKDIVPASIAATMGNYPELGRLTQQKIKGSKLVEIAGTGHLPHIESFEIFIKALSSFLLQRS